MLEMESLGPLGKIAPGAFLEHEERWSLFRDVKLEGLADDEIDREVLAKVREA
jgi:hypothetical protein